MKKYLRMEAEGILQSEMNSNDVLTRKKLKF